MNEEHKIACNSLVVLIACPGNLKLLGLGSCVLQSVKNLPFQPSVWL